MFNEEFVKNEKYLNDVTFINAPVISALGVKLFGAETDYKFDDAKCDDVLSLIVKYAQAGKTVEQIKTLVDTELSVDVAVADVKTVCERAGYVKSDPGLGIAISEKSTKKEIAELFLRFCASQDGGKIFSEQSRSMSPYSKSVNANDKYAWTNSVYNILNNPYAKNIRSSATGYRLRMGVSSILPSLADPYSTSLQGKVTKYDPETLKIVATDAVYAEIAKKTAEDIFNYAKKAVEEGTWKEIK
jgi:ABC-type glycerol-3-phosphate transport system substrate-binding protein